MNVRLAPFLLFTAAVLPFDPFDVGIRLAVAATGGLAVGVEREW